MFLHSTVSEVEFHNLVLVHSMLAAGMILLHHPLAATNSTSMDKCQTWARKVIYAAEMVPDAHFCYLSPIMTVSTPQGCNID